jgi:hypothetical protein
MVQTSLSEKILDVFGNLRAGPALSRRKQPGFSMSFTVRCVFPEGQAKTGGPANLLSQLPCSDVNL